MYIFTYLFYVVFFNFPKTVASFASLLFKLVRVNICMSVKLYRLFELLNVETEVVRIQRRDTKITKEKPLDDKLAEMK